MERYEVYKDSGVEWIGEIPAEWEVEKLKYVAVARPSNIDKKSKDEEEPVSLCNYVDVYKNEFINRELTFMRATAAQEQIEKFLLQKGDILATKDSESPDDIANPALVVEDFDGVVCGYHLTHIKPKKIIGSYLFRYFQTNYLNSYFEVSANGVTRYGLGVDKFDSALILNPSMDEQTAIANFLDRKTAEIDALIAQKERLLELYEEEKAALINHAVTKGLDPNAELKDSGVEWLSKIPVGWEVKKLKYTAYLKSGNNLTSDQIKEDGVYPVYGGNGLRGYYHGFTHEGEFVLIGRQGALCGNINYATNKFWATEHAVVVEPLSEYKFVWMGELLRTMNLNQYSVAAAQPGLSVEAICNLFIPWPLLEEQESIVEYIEAETARIDAKIAKTQRIIELQKEYRTALISEVVTGMIKVPKSSTQEASA